MMKMAKQFGLVVAFLGASGASAMEFACANVDGSGSGDFDFSQICLNDDYAVLRTGTFESSESLYRVKLDAASGKYHLTPQKVADPNWKVGEAIVLTVKGGSVGKYTLVHALVGQSRSVEVDHGPSDSESHTASKFAKQDVTIVL